MRHHLEIACRTLILSLMLCTGLSLAHAQDITGALNGIVKDTTGAAVAGATVTISDESKNIVIRTVTTGEEGEYSAPSLPVGIYSVAVEAPNFKKSIQTNIKVDVGQRRSVDVNLEAGNIAETVTVEADPVAVELTTAAASTVINGDQVRELSINNRNFVQLVTLAPGVSSDLADQVYVGNVNPEGQANTINLSVNGARSSQNTFTVDGADITDRGSNITIQAFPSVDSIGEFRVLRSLYPAESGNSGGGQVNVVTRSGGEDFHGSLFEFVRNERLNANDFFSNQTAPVGRTPDGRAKRRPFRYNNYGFTVGGPIYFFNFGEGSDGGIFKKLKRTFFFFSEEQRRDLRYPTLNSTVPDANLRSGVFPIPVCINRNDVPGATCTGANILPANTPLPANLFNPAAVSYLNQIYSKIPLPTNPATYGLISAAVNKADFRQEIIKIDHNFTDTLSAFYRYENDKIPTLDSNALFSSGSGLPGVSTTQTNSPGRAHTFQTTYVVNPRAIIEGRYAYSYGAILSENVGLISTRNSTNPVTLPFANTRDRITSIAGNGFSNIQGFGPYDNFSNKRIMGASLSLVNGGHTMKFGGNYSKYRKNENALILDANGANQGIFTAFSAALPQGVTASTVNQNLQRWANFLVGNALTFVQGKFDYTGDLRQHNYEAYAQDEWRFRPNLTLYYGVRYSQFSQPTDKNGRLSNFDPRLYNPANAPQVTGAGNRVAGTGNFCNGMYVNSQNYQTAVNCTPATSPFGEQVVETAKNNFAPRVGLAWDPFGEGRTSVRTGYGIYHEQILSGWLLQMIGQNPPYQENFTISNTRLDNPGASATNPPSAAASTIRGMDPDWHTPYTQHWSLDVQHQLTSNTVASIGYYGSKGTHLIGVVEINELPPGRALNSQCAPGANTFQTPGVTLVPCLVPGTGFFTTAATNLIDQLRPYKGYRSITMLSPRFNSNYHSMQVSAQHRFAGESQVNLAYTWSKNLTDSQTDRSTAPQNSYDIRSEYARATLDRRHVFSLNYIYELPFFRSQEGFTGKLLGGWQASGIVTYNTGLPFTATTSAFDPAGLGFIPAAIAGGRPNLLCDPNANAPRTQQEYFNTACFQANPAANETNIVNLPGSAGRGVINGPSTSRVDFTMTKNIRFNESMRLQLRGEAFNILNHTNFRSLGTNRTLGTFGQVTAVRDPRTIQLGVKFYF
ncbi:MAG TPA: carboxypeptidase regulatory-like domain-containing protein [Pyrinomonadaceae bacterium]|nr:carboxypeptidase regulatory-like domain-containing protein [Pyrinomonadaceae bacterium]